MIALAGWRYSEALPRFSAGWAALRVVGAGEEAFQGFAADEAAAELDRGQLPGADHVLDEFAADAEGVGDLLDAERQSWLRLGGGLASGGLSPSALQRRQHDHRKVEDDGEG